MTASLPAPSLRWRLRNTKVGHLIRDVRERQRLRSWRLSGQLGPPPHRLKQQIVLEYARRYGTTSLVETGTYLGDMIEATRSHFERIWSIELDRTMFLRASARFSGPRDRHIRILQGDSSVVLKEVLAQLEGRALFWLDAHYSGSGTAHGELETPIRIEVEFILARETDRDVILIDDAQMFDGRQYPLLDAFVKELRTHPAVDDASVVTTSSGLSPAGGFPLQRTPAARFPMHKRMVVDREKRHLSGKQTCGTS